MTVSCDELIEEWMSRNDIDNLDDDIRSGWVEWGDRGPIFVYSQGDLVVQGEPIGLNDEWLVVNGLRHAWDRGPVEWEGDVSVTIGWANRIEVDGP